LRRGNLEVVDFFNAEIAEFIPSDKIEIASPSARNDKRGTCSQRQLKDFFSDLLKDHPLHIFKL
jgi:hypothetical protein